MKINFAKLKVQTSFDGSSIEVNTANKIGNMMMYNGSILLDIGFEDLAKQIYYSTEEVDVPERYAKAIAQVIRESSFIASVKRELIKQIENGIYPG